MNEQERGAKVLDRVKPGWQEKTNPPTFNIDECDCIICQVFGDYFKGVEILFGDDHWNISEFDLIRYGFIPRPGEEAKYISNWKKQINIRRKHENVHSGSWLSWFTRSKLDTQL